MKRRKLNPKRSTEAATKAALRQRLLDMASGADGCDMSAPLECGEAYVGEWLARWVGAIRDRLLGGREGRWANYVREFNIGYFDTIDNAVDHLYDAGVRADGSHLKQEKKP